MSLLKATKKEKKPLFYRQMTLPSRVDWLGIRNSARIHSTTDSCQQNCENLNGFS